MLFLDGVYVEDPDGALAFRWVKAPTGDELSVLAGRIASRVGRFLERQGLLERDAERASLEDVERAHIERVLDRTRWVIEGKQGAAALLGLNPSTLRGRMRKLGIGISNAIEQVLCDQSGRSYGRACATGSALMPASPTLRRAYQLVRQRPGGRGLRRSAVQRRRSGGR